MRNVPAHSNAPTSSTRRLYGLRTPCNGTYRTMFGLHGHARSTLAGIARLPDRKFTKETMPESPSSRNPVLHTPRGGTTKKTAKSTWATQSVHPNKQHQHKTSPTQQNLTSMIITPQRSATFVNAEAPYRKNSSIGLRFRTIYEATANNDKAPRQRGIWRHPKSHMACETAVR